MVDGVDGGRWTVDGTRMRTRTGRDGTGRDGPRGLRVVLLAGEAFGESLSNFTTYVAGVSMSLNIHRGFNALLKSHYIDYI